MSKKRKKDRSGFEAYEDTEAYMCFEEEEDEEDGINWDDRDLEERDAYRDEKRRAHVLGMLEAGLAQATREKQILRLYDLYWESGNEAALGELLDLAETMTRKIVTNTLRDKKFYQGNEESRQTSKNITLLLMVKLREDYAAGVRRENIVNTIRAFYKNRTVDAIRVKYRKHGLVFVPAKEDVAGGDFTDTPGWRAGPHAVTVQSWEEVNSDMEGNPMDRIGQEDDIHDADKTLLTERGELSARLQHLYLSAMLKYSREPYKAIALCYARVLFHVERLLDPEEIQRAGDLLAARDTRKKVSDMEKRITAYHAVQSPKTTTAPKWAMERMAGLTLRELAEDAQRSLQRNVDPSLVWSESFMAMLEKPSGRGSQKWGDIVLTEEFTYKQITKFAETIHVTVFHGAQALMQLYCPGLMDEAVRLGFDFWCKGLPERKENRE